MDARQRIAKLESLLARVRQRAQAPRATQARAPMPTVPPTPEARALEHEMRTPPTTVPEPHVAPPVEPEMSRTRVVPDVTSSLEVTMEIDESELAAAPAVEIVVEEEPTKAEDTPPSSKRPMTMEAIAEAQKDEPPPPPPPESGKHVAAPSAEAFDDDFTGVREASNLLPPLAKDEPAIEVQELAPPKPAPVHEMEVDLAPPPPPPIVAPVVDVSPSPAKVEPGKIEPARTVATLARAEAVQVRGAAPSFKPKSFGELLDATLDL